MVLLVTKTILRFVSSLLLEKKIDQCHQRHNHQQIILIRWNILWISSITTTIATITPKWIHLRRNQMIINYREDWTNQFTVPTNRSGLFAFNVLIKSYACNLVNSVSSVWWIRLMYSQSQYLSSMIIVSLVISYTQEYQFSTVLASTQIQFNINYNCPIENKNSQNKTETWYVCEEKQTTKKRKEK